MVAPLLLVLCTVTAFADTTVEYRGKTEGIVFTSADTDDLFDNFKNVMPGDTLSQTITVSNLATDSDYIKIYLKAIPVDESQVEMLDFLSQMTLTLYQDGTELYKNNPDETGALTTNQEIGYLTPNSTVTLVAELEVPITMGNQFANMTGDIIWEFTVDAYTNSVGSSTTTPTDDSDDPDDTTTPTGEITITIQDEPEEPEEPTDSTEVTDEPVDTVVPTELGDTLLETGQLNWPIPVMAVAGVLLIAVGLVILRKRGNHG